MSLLHSKLVIPTAAACLAGLSSTGSVSTHTAMSRPGEERPRLHIFPTKADAAAVRNDNRSVVEWVVDVRQSLVRTRRSLIGIRRTLHAESFMRSFVVEDLDEFEDAVARAVVQDDNGTKLQRDVVGLDLTALIDTRQAAE